MWSIKGGIMQGFSINVTGKGDLPLQSLFSEFYY